LSATAAILSAFFKKALTGHNRGREPNEPQPSLPCSCAALVFGKNACQVKGCVCINIAAAFWGGFSEQSRQVISTLRVASQGSLGVHNPEAWLGESLTSVPELRRHAEGTFTVLVVSAAERPPSADSGTPPISAPPRRLARGSYASKFPASSLSTHARASRTQPAAARRWRAGASGASASASGDSRRSAVSLGGIAAIAPREPIHRFGSVPQVDVTATRDD
jgi:hypothetical protein